MLDLGELNLAAELMTIYSSDNLSQLPQISQAFFLHRPTLERLEYARPSRDCLHRGVIKDRTKGRHRVADIEERKNYENHTLTGNRSRGRVELRQQR